MAKITITIEDAPGDKVKITSTPSFEEIANMINSGTPGTAAHGYAMAMTRAAREVSKSNEPKTPIWLPKVRRT